jgi:hypothetical protein
VYLHIIYLHHKLNKKAAVYTYNHYMTMMLSLTQVLISKLVALLFCKNYMPNCAYIVVRSCVEIHVGINIKTHALDK